MNKRLLATAIAGAFIASGPAFAASMPTISLSGWGETIFTLADDFGEDNAADADGDAANSTERKFATDGEIDLNAAINDQLSARADVDINSASASNDLQMEQLFATWKANDMFDVRFGRFNNPLNYEGQDAPDITTITSSLISAAVTQQVSRGGTYQNNLEGLALDFMAGPAKVTLGVVNDIGGVAEENSFLAHASGSVAGFDVALGILTQEDNAVNNTGSAENLIDFNAAYNLNVGMPAKVWVEYLSAGEILDNAWTIGASAMFTDMFGLTVRYDTLKYDSNADDNTALTVALTARPAEHLDILLEWRSDEFQAGAGGNQALAGGQALNDPNEDSADRILLSGVYTF
jgi:hypothetical protein